MTSDDIFKRALVSTITTGVVKGTLIAVFVMWFRNRFEVWQIFAGLSVGVLVGILTQYFWYYRVQHSAHCRLLEEFGDEYRKEFDAAVRELDADQMINRNWFTDCAHEFDRKLGPRRRND